MQLHQQVGILFIAFDLFSLVWNVFTPNNPDHVLNMIEQTAMAGFFIMAYYAPAKMAQAIQIVCLVVIAFIPMSLSDSPFWGAVVAVVALDLLYAYGGFRTRPVWKFFVGNVVMYTLCVIAHAHFEPPSVESYARALVWTIFVNVFCWLQWAIVEYRERNGAFAQELVKQNRELLEELKALQGGEDAVADRKDQRT